MRKIFQYINRQPKNVRDNYALGIASLFTCVVLLFWVVSRPNGEIVASDTDNSSSLFSTLLKGTKEKFSQLNVANEQNIQTDNSLSAAVINSSSTTAGELILNEADIEKAKQDLEKVSQTNSATNSQNYTEVMIGTTSSAVGLGAESCFEVGTGTQSGTSCFGSIKTSTTTQ